jgi:hypothetical protein
LDRIAEREASEGPEEQIAAASAVQVILARDGAVQTQQSGTQRAWAEQVNPLHPGSWRGLFFLRGNPGPDEFGTRPNHLMRLRDPPAPEVAHSRTYYGWISQDAVLWRLRVKRFVEELPSLSRRSFGCMSVAERIHHDKVVDDSAIPRHRNVDASGA